MARISIDRWGPPFTDLSYCELWITRTGGSMCKVGGGAQARGWGKELTKDWDAWLYQTHDLLHEAWRNAVPGRAGAPPEPDPPSPS